MNEYTVKYNLRYIFRSIRTRNRVTGETFENLLAEIEGIGSLGYNLNQIIDFGPRYSLPDEMTVSEFIGHMFRLSIRRNAGPFRTGIRSVVIAPTFISDYTLDE